MELSCRWVMEWDGGTAGLALDSAGSSGVDEMWQPSADSL